VSKSIESKIKKKLTECFDPEIPVNIVDLGLIYKISEKNGNVKILMTLTNPFCPLTNYLVSSVKQKALEVKGVRNVDVEITFDPPWSPEKMSKKAKKILSSLK